MTAAGTHVELPLRRKSGLRAHAPAPTGAPLTRRGFLCALGLFAAAVALADVVGCAHTAGPAAPPSPTAAPPPRLWDDTEILRAGRWAG